jgi:hypothetical protein
MDIGKIVEEGERVLPGIPTFPTSKPAPASPQPAAPAPVKAPAEKEKVPA